MEIIREAADPKCSNHLSSSISTIDGILTGGPEFFKKQLKNLFGLGGLEHDDDFASVLEVCGLNPQITVGMLNVYILEPPWVMASEMLGPKSRQHTL